MEIRNYLTILSGRKWLIIATFVVTILAVTIGTLLITPTFTGTSTIRIATAAGSTSSSDYMYADRIMNTYVRIANSGPILNKLRERLQSKSIPKVTVTILPNTELIQITVEDPNPQVAMNAANILADILISDSQELYTGSGKSQSDILQEQLTQIQNELQSKRIEYEKLIAQNPADKQAVETISKSITLQEGTYATLLAQYEQTRLREALRSNMVSLVDPATFPTKPSKPKLFTNIVLGGLVGLIGGVGLAFLLESVSRVLYTENQVEQLTGLHSLGSIPVVKLQNGLFTNFNNGKMANGNKPNHQALNSFTALKTNILYNLHEPPLQTLLFTSADPGEGKSTIVSNLAIVMAQSGHKVIVVDADLRKPQIKQRFNIKNEVGLSSVLTHKTSIKEAIQNTSIPNLSVLTSGPIMQNPIELLESQEMSVLIKDLKSEYDFILVDSPAIQAVMDALILIPQIDAVSLVVRSSSSRTESLKEAIKKLDRVKAKIIGVIINRDRKSQRGYYSYYTF